MKKIKISLPNSGYISLRLFDINGRLIESLATGYYKKGTYHWTWYPEKNDYRVATGLYVISLNADNSIINRKILYLK